jgi:hypothetical protein
MLDGVDDGRWDEAFGFDEGVHGLKVVVPVTLSGE